MKKIILTISLLISSTACAVEGYEDIYIDREQDIIIHGIVCGKDLKNLRALRPSYIFTNTDTLLKGTYHYNSSRGNYALTFKPTKNTAVMVRELLKKGQVVKNVCIVSPVEGLPQAITKNLSTKRIKANDPNWDKMMTQYTFISGKPAYGKGVFQDTRTTAKFDKANQETFQANQNYLKKIEEVFSVKYNEITSALPEKLKGAIEYALKKDGFAVGKTYPVIKEPAVWTAIARERYNDLNRRRSQTIAWDKVIQENFDWLFALVGKDNTLKTTHFISTTKPAWNGQILEQLATVQATFENGKFLELDFLVTSSKVDSQLFDNMETIKKESLLERNSPYAFSKKSRSPVQLPSSKSIKVYTPTEKEVIFFSPFRNKKVGDTYRYF